MGVDLVGQQFGLLTVLEYECRKKTFRTGLTRYIPELFCNCACGKSKWFNQDHVTSGRSKSCGCWNYKKNCKPAQDKTITYVFNYIRKSAQNRRLEFSLSKEQIAELVFQNCHYCGEEAKSRSSKILAKAHYAQDRKPSHGLDRIDSDRGYVVGNVVPCCSKCNTAKWDMTGQQFLTHIAKIYNYQLREA